MPGLGRARGRRIGWRDWAGRFQVVRRLVLRWRERFDARWQDLAHVEAARALAVVPVEPVPVWAMPRAMRRALPALHLAAAHILLPVDDPIRPDARHPPAGLAQSHAESLHKSPSSTTPDGHATHSAGLRYPSSVRHL